MTTTTAATMKAFVQHRYGSPDVMTLAQVPLPVPAPGEVLVRVVAASVNARDWHVMRGEPRVARLLARDTFGLRRPRVATRGTDLAGVVEAVGDGVTSWRPGDAVLGEADAAFAERVVVPAERLVAKPERLGFDEAAALPLAATTAHLLLDAAAGASGGSVLVNGASGGVGTFAVQLARLRGHRVTAVVSTRNAGLATRLGAHDVVDHTREDFTRRAERYDVVVDLVGNRSLRDLRGVVRPGGTLVLSGGGVSGAGRLVGPMRLLVWGQTAGRLSGLRVVAPQATPDPARLAEVAELAATGRIEVVVDRRYRLDEVPAAIHYLESEHARAKVVITV